jgi:hypothetical protein
MPSRKKARVRHEFLQRLSISFGSKIPDPSTGLSTPGEYDLYFQIERNNPGLLEWSRSCIAVSDAQPSELSRTSLTEREQCQILKGMLIVHRSTLGKWVNAGEAVKGSAVHDQFTKSSAGLKREISFKDAPP